MKKTVLCLALAALSAGSALNAATQLTGGVSVSLDGILANEDNAAAKNVMAYSAGSLFVATAIVGERPASINAGTRIKPPPPATLSINPAQNDAIIKNVSM